MGWDFIDTTKTHDVEVDGVIVTVKTLLVEQRIALAMEAAKLREHKEPGEVENLDPLRKILADCIVKIDTPDIEGKSNFDILRSIAMPTTFLGILDAVMRVNTVGGQLSKNSELPSQSDTQTANGVTGAPEASNV